MDDDATNPPTPATAPPGEDSPPRITAGLAALGTLALVAATLLFAVRTATSWHDDREMRAIPVCSTAPKLPSLTLGEDPADLTSNDHPDERGCLVRDLGNLSANFVTRRSQYVTYTFCRFPCVDRPGAQQSVRVPKVDGALSDADRPEGLFLDGRLVAFYDPDRKAVIPTEVYGSRSWISRGLLTVTLALASWMAFGATRLKRRRADSWWGPAPRVLGDPDLPTGARFALGGVAAAWLTAAVAVPAGTSILITVAAAATAGAVIVVVSVRHSRRPRGKRAA